MDVLVDINIIVDHFSGRPPFGPAAQALWTKIINRQVRAVVCANTLTTFFYLMEKLSDSATAQQAIADIIASCEVWPVDRGLLEKGLQKAWPDFEDAVQDAAAEAAGIPIIVTHNPSDFAGSTRRIVDAVTLVRELDQAASSNP